MNDYPPYPSDAIMEAACEHEKTCVLCQQDQPCDEEEPLRRNYVNACLAESRVILRQVDERN